jgi:hypothetical protein
VGRTTDEGKSEEGEREAGEKETAGKARGTTERYEVLQLFGQRLGFGFRNIIHFVLLWYPEAS